MKRGALFLVIGLFLTGCAANTRYQIECKNAPGPYNYNGWKTCPDVCPDEGTIVTVKTRWGWKTYRVSNCSEHYRVIRWKRIKGQ